MRTVRTDLNQDNKNSGARKSAESVSVRCTRCKECRRVLSRVAVRPERAPPPPPEDLPELYTGRLAGYFVGTRGGVSKRQEFCF